MVRSAALSYMSSRSGDLMVVPKEYWFMSPRAVHRDDARVALRVRHARAGDSSSAARIKAGRSKASVTPADIAPTLADSPGVELPRPKGAHCSEAKDR